MHEITVHAATHALFVNLAKAYAREMKRSPPNPAFNRTRRRRGLNCLARAGGGAGPVN